MTTDTRPANADLAAIKERVDLASPPPWEYDGSGDGPALTTAYEARWEGDIPHPVWTCDDPEDGCMDDAAGFSNDGTFMAHARTDIPALIAKIEELRAVLEPLLGAPTGRYADHLCQFCGAFTAEPYGGDEPHAPDCPARPENADRLLGRA